MSEEPLIESRGDWLQWRRGGFGASEAAALVGLSRYASQWSLWADKVGLTRARESTQRQRIGLLLEDAIGKLFSEQTGLYIAGEQTWCTHSELTWARCTVDGFVVESADSSISDALGVHEIKTDGRFGWADVPVEIRAQCVWQMAVTQLDHCWLSVLFGGFSFDVFELHWDADAQHDWALMRDAGDKLWHEHVLTGIPPDIDGSDATYRALLDVYPEHDPGERVSLDHLRDLIDERSELSRREREIKSRLDELRNTLIESFGTAELGTIDDVPVLSCRWADRAGYIVEPSRVRTLRAASKPDKEAMTRIKENA